MFIVYIVPVRPWWSTVGSLASVGSICIEAVNHCIDIVYIVDIYCVLQYSTITTQYRYWYSPTPFTLHVYWG